jgi:hypothetical protein
MIIACQLPPALLGEKEHFSLFPQTDLMIGYIKE